MKTFLQGLSVQVRISRLLTALILMTVLLFAIALGVMSSDSTLIYAAQNTDAGYGTSGGGTGSGGSDNGYQGGSGSGTLAPTEGSGGATGGSSGQGDGDQEGSKPDGVGIGGSTGGGKPDGVGDGEEGEEPVAGNNLSFPVIAADGFALTTITMPSFSVIYDGPYNNLSEEEKALLQGRDWYAQKTEGNLWQADYVQNDVGSAVEVYGVDWGDNVEAVNPVIGRPFRVEVTLYHQPVEIMTGYVMQLLAFPSSPNEVQGTNGDTYESSFATIVSPQPRMSIQYLGEADASSLEWEEGGWASDGEVLPVTSLAFASELNVGGKYIFGASKGGWKPVEPGVYRLTFYVPVSDISFSEAVIGNYGDWIAAVEEGGEEDEETGAAQPVVDAENNLTYVDVTVVTKHESRKPENPGEGEDEEITTLSSSATTVVDQCEAYLTDYLGEGLENDPVQVVLLQKFLNDTLNLSLILDGVYDTETADVVSLFQITYAEDVLQPWVDAGHDDVDMEEGTGYVGVTTLELINDMMCEV